ncbi:MAG: ATP-dependent DNA helicase, partial [Bacilli bacterium]|nr:ATP-dependent DNA helicase [Bacilli bacterium]
MAEKKPYLQLSVHDVVDFLLRAGDIDDRVYNQEAMELGSKIHASFQKKQGKEYLSEYLLGETYERPLGTIVLSGRADGIIVGGEVPIIDEIKSTVLPLKVFYEQQLAWHLGQAECYALMYAHQEKLDRIDVRLTYISQREEGQESHEFHYQLADLESKVHGYLDEYLAFHQRSFEHRKSRDQSCAKLDFPFAGFRKGQRELAKYSYGIAKKGGFLFAEAPTGIGKTMSTLYPFVKSFLEGKNERIFYLTAKTTGQEAAKEALLQMKEKGLDARISYLKAKDKICLSPGKACNPDECPFAQGYYSKLKGVIDRALKSERDFDEGYLQMLGYEESICPFELQLDLSLFSDVLVGDYNYLFDPMVKLDRYFGEMADPSHSLVLINEAHNLIDRGRGMYSAEITDLAIHKAKKALKGKAFTSLKRALTKVQKALINEAVLHEDDLFFVYPSPPSEMDKSFESLKRALQKFNKDVHPSLPDDFRDLYFEVNKYLRLLEDYFGGGSKIYLSQGNGLIRLKLFCLDPSSYLNESLSALKGAVIFSATLSPISYYMNGILGEEEEPFLLLPSPFPKENFLLMLAPKVSTRYKDRANTYHGVAEYLSRFVEAKMGNYFLYFPSYDYLENVMPYLHFKDATILYQRHEMSDLEKSDFLAQFQKNPSKTTVGLLVLGGSFSEGIDLVDDRLIGVGIVGIGLPQIGGDNDLIRDYYQEKRGQGFEYAYMDPGMNKIMQAAGRLIRSETDVGACLLIDDRYL